MNGQFKKLKILLRVPIWRYFIVLIYLVLIFILQIILVTVNAVLHIHVLWKMVRLSVHIF